MGDNDAKSGPSRGSFDARARLPGRSARPRWVVVLAMAMLAVGGNLLLGGVAIVRGLSPSRGAPTLQDLGAMSIALAAAHPVAVVLNAVSKILFGLLLLYAVAAVFTSDRRARAATLLAAWVGIAYQIGDALFLFLLMRQRIAPLLASLAAANGGPTPAPTVQDLAPLTDVVIFGTALLGIAFSVLLLAFFGGRRGRGFFGPGRQPRPGHGG